MDPEKIGKFICELRKEKNLSQYQLADMIPITRQGVSKWERGVTTPDPQTLLKLSELFDVSINELLNGERVPKATIEETTLSILDESNKKTKTIKRITFISISIITVLLLSFLSYYFINSYNTTEVYTISGKSNGFRTYGGLMIITKEKVYMKLGKLKYNSEIEIKNLKLFYKKNNKNKLIVEDQDIDNIVIKDSFGYGEKLKDNKINNLYLEITYNDEQKEVLKLKPKKDFSNSSLFFEKQHKNIKTKLEEKPIENKESEETKEEKKEEVQPPKEPEITIDQVISKIKETCIQDMDSYFCEYSNIMIFYFGDTNQINIFRDGDQIVEYQFNDNVCYSDTVNCKVEFKNIVKETLFS